MRLKKIRKLYDASSKIIDLPEVKSEVLKKAAVTFAWSTTPYRSEWKFDITAHKKILIDVGHICQNLYLAGESVDVGV